MLHFYTVTLLHYIDATLLYSNIATLDATLLHCNITTLDSTLLYCKIATLNTTLLHCNIATLDSTPLYCNIAILRNLLFHIVTLGTYLLLIICKICVVYLSGWKIILNKTHDSLCHTFCIPPFFPGPKRYEHRRTVKTASGKERKKQCDRFGEISPFWPKFKLIWQHFEGLLSIWHNFESTLANFVCLWTNVYCC